MKACVVESVLLLLVLFGAIPTSFSDGLKADLIAEETITFCLPANNGAGPMWCYGSPLMVRDGDEVFVSIPETGEGVEPLCNTRWRLFRRNAEGWKLMQAADQYRLREPSPLVRIDSGALLLSITPSTEPPGTHYGPVLPQLLRFNRENPTDPPAVEIPEWGEPRHFTDHSYRGVTSDASSGEVMWLNIDAKTSVQHVSHRNSSGEWTYRGGIEFPVRSAYPQSALVNGAAHVLAIGDIVEPIEMWRQFKFEQSGQKWDYVFRRLYYVHTADLPNTPFSEPLEIDTVESTAGHITNLDLWIGPEGEAHILYLKTSVQSEVMRDRFFPGLPILKTLEYTVIAEGRITRRETLLVGGEGDHPVTPIYGRFHATPDGRLWAVYSAFDRKESGVSQTLFLMPVYPEIDRENPVEVSLRKPMGAFFTAPERGGSSKSWTLDLFGQIGNTLHYAQVLLSDASRE